MQTEALVNEIDSLSKALVMTDVSDLPGLGEVLKRLEAFSNMRCDDSPGIVFDVSERSAKLLERIILEEVEDKEASFETLSKAVSCIQSIVRDGRDPSEVEFPPELGLDSIAQARNKSPDGTTNLPPGVDETIIDEFLSAQEVSLEEIEGIILGMKDMKTPDTLAEIRRRLHTLKGEAGVLGLNDIVNVCHATESQLENKDSLPPADTLLAVKDWIYQRIHDYASGTCKASPAGDIISLLSRPSTSSESTENETLPGDEMVEKEETIEFTIPEGDPSIVGDFITEAKEHLDKVDIALLDLETDSGNQDALNDIFRAFHTMKGTAGFLKLEDIKELAHSTETLLDLARKGVITIKGRISDMMFEIVDTMKHYLDEIAVSLSSGKPYVRDKGLATLLSKIDLIEKGEVSAEDPVEPSDKEIGKILVESGSINSEDLREVLKEQKNNQKDKKVGEILIEKGYAAPVEIAAGLRKQKSAKDNQKIHLKDTVRIDTSRIDALVDTIGEVVIAESMITQDPDVYANASLRVQKNLRQLTKVTRELQEIGMAMRMVSLKGIFQKMARLVRDLSRKSNKKINFVMQGEDTEIDRSVVDKIGDPLIHLIRNAVDHGIETNEIERINTGKPAYATIELKALHKGGSIYIEVKDDGRGIDRDAVLAKARDKGLITTEDSLSDQDITGLIFQPGFSTTKKVTDISGRGVGLDVVKKSIETLRGRIEVQTEKGKGSTFTLVLPLTLAIIDGMVIKVGSERYIIPTLSIIESISPVSGMLSMVTGKGELLSVRGELIPFFRLSRLFNIQGAKEDPGEAIAVIVESGIKKVALMVDSLIGQQQIVIKGLSMTLGKTEYLSGAAIMADGRVGLILDIPGLIQIATKMNAYISQYSEKEDKDGAISATCC